MKKQFTKVLALFLALSMILALAACGNTSSGSGSGGENASTSDGQAETASGSQEGDAPEGEGTKIGILLPTIEAEYFVNVANTIESGLSDLGYKFTTTSYDWSADKEIQAVENFVIGGMDAIIVVAFDNAADSAFASAMEAGVKVVVAGTETENHDYQVISDNKLVGECIAKMAVDWVNENLDGKAQIAILSSEGSVSGADRTAGMTSVLESELPESEIVLVQDPGSEAGSGNAFADNLLLLYPDINVVCSISDDRGLEVYESFKAANHVGDDVAIFGCDCNTQALTYISEGTCYRGSADTGNYGQIIVDILPALLADDTSIGTETVCTGEGVTIDNVADYLG